MKRANHYEAAFEAYLRRLALPYVAVDEAKRSHWAGESLKNVDFIVSPPGHDAAWLVDVKGRGFPSAGKQYWRNWATRDELRSLARWEQLFGARFRAALVFAYQLLADKAPASAEHVFEHRQNHYVFVAVALTDYAAWARPLSAKWDTVTLPAGRFRELALPVACWWRETQPTAARGEGA